MNRKRVLFICVHNSARSQMAEAFANRDHGDALVAESAGLEPGTINPLAVAAMADAGIDISGNPTKSVFDKYKKGELFDYVITVCKGSENKCPIFPGIIKRVDWPFDDPGALTGSPSEQLEQTIVIRDQIRSAVAELAKEARARNGRD